MSHPVHCSNSSRSILSLAISHKQKQLEEVHHKKSARGLLRSCLLCCDMTEPIRQECPASSLGYDLKTGCVSHRQLSIILSTFSVVVDASGQILIGLHFVIEQSASAVYLLDIRTLSILQTHNLSSTAFEFPHFDRRMVQCWHIWSISFSGCSTL